MTEGPQNISLARTGKNSVGIIKMKTNVEFGKVIRIDVGARTAHSG